MWTRTTQHPLLDIQSAVFFFFPAVFYLTFWIVLKDVFHYISTCQHFKFLWVFFLLFYSQRLQKWVLLHSYLFIYGICQKQLWRQSSHSHIKQSNSLAALEFRSPINSGQSHLPFTLSLIEVACLSKIMSLGGIYSSLVFMCNAYICRCVWLMPELVGGWYNAGLSIKTVLFGHC